MALALTAHIYGIYIIINTDNNYKMSISLIISHYWTDG